MVRPEPAAELGRSAATHMCVREERRIRHICLFAAVGVALSAAYAAPVMAVGAQTVALRAAGVTFRKDAVVLARTSGTIPWRTAVDAPQSAGGRRRFEGGCSAPSLAPWPGGPSAARP